MIKLVSELKYSAVMWSVFAWLLASPVAVLAAGASEEPKATAAILLDESANVPELYAPKMLHYFGVMQPGQVAKHRFLIENKGTTPLEITSVRGSCKCLQYTVTPEVISPGEQGWVNVTWRAVDKPGETFRQLVEVRTNDPKNKTANFIISGEVGGHLKLRPGRIEWKNAKPGEPKTKLFEVGSNFWPELHVGNLRTTVEGLDCRVIESSESANHKVGLVQIKAPAELTKAEFSGLLTMTVAPHPIQSQTNSAEGSMSEVVGQQEGKSNQAVEIQVPISFSLGDPISITGAGFNHYSNLALLGIQKRGQEIRRRYVVKVRDKDPRLTLRSLKVVPEVITAKFEPYNEAKGLYRLELVLPAGSLDRAYVGDKAGSVKMEFDHPRAKSLEFKLEVSPSN